MLQSYEVDVIVGPSCSTGDLHDIIEATLEPHIVYAPHRT